jgi:hypothetical protein
MDYGPIIRQYLRMYRLMDLNDFMGGVFDQKSDDGSFQEELDSLLDEFGLDCADLDAWDAISGQLCGCQEVAPEPIRQEYHLADYPHATYHDVWREWMTAKLLDGPDPDTYAIDLYQAYVRDVAVIRPGLATSKFGFRVWMEEQPWNTAFIVNVWNQISNDPKELPA